MFPCVDTVKTGKQHLQRLQICLRAAYSLQSTWWGRQPWCQPPEVALMLADDTRADTAVHECSWPVAAGSILSLWEGVLSLLTGWRHLIRRRAELLYKCLATQSSLSARKKGSRCAWEGLTYVKLELGAFLQPLVAKCISSPGPQILKCVPELTGMYTCMYLF